jgi:hypothetical protein
VTTLAEALRTFGRHLPLATKGVGPLFFNGFLDGKIEGHEVLADFILAQAVSSRVSLFSVCGEGAQSRMAAFLGCSGERHHVASLSGAELHLAEAVSGA